MGAARYKPYPAYKPSYAAWSGDVPDHWPPIRLKHVFAEKKKVHNPALPAGSISFGNVIYKNEESLAKETKAAYQELRCGEFLINPLNMNYDLLSLRTALSSIDVVVSTGYMILQSVEGYDKNYLRWLLQQFDVAHMKTLGAGVRQTISYADIGNSFIFEPPLPEQTKIAAFLDYETGKIDALIAKQERLIALLEEKRQAVISHTVTKGLNADAPLRPSGIDWLGDVPEHWEVKRLKFLAIESVSGPYGSSLTKSMYASSGIKVYGQQQVIGNDLSMGDYYISESKFLQMKRYEVHPGELLISVMGTIGKAAVVPNNVERGIINPRLVKYRLNQNLVHPSFVRTAVLSDTIQSKLRLEAQGSTMDGLNMTILGALPIAFPNLEEQAEILLHVDNESRKYDQLIDRSQSAITLLKERRTALISAAVTGKIDVRDWQPPQPLSDTDLRTNTLQEAAL